MYSLDRAKQEIVALLNAAEPALGAVVADLVKPPQEEMGDIAFPCFRAAKELKQSPAAVAAALAPKLVPSGMVAAISAAGPYLNFKFDRPAFAAALVADVREKGEKFGHAEAPTGEKIMVEYFSANTHKEIHVGHLRNMALGLAICRLYRAAGHEVVPATYIGDIGAHVAKCLWYLQQHREEEPVPDDHRGRFLGRLYTAATRVLEEHKPAEGEEPGEEYKRLRAEVAEVQRLLEAENPGWHKLWLETREWSLDEMKEVAGEFGMEFDRWYFESEVEGPGKQLVKDLMESGLAKISQGATVIDLEDEGLGVFLVLKSDGSALYATKELALAGLKYREYPDLTRSVNIVDVRQSQYFRQFFAALKKMGFEKPMSHLAYEFVTLKEGAMSSRTGNIITYEDVRDEVVARATKEARERHPEWDDEKVKRNAWLVAEGAMKFWLLKQGIERPIVFDIDQALAFDGFTGPYVQYACARLSAILRKAPRTNEVQGEGGVDAAAKFEGSDDPGEYRLARLVADLPDSVLAAASASNPALLAQHLFDLAEGVSAFYRDVPVLAEGVASADRARRLDLCAAALRALQNGLHLLGITAPEEM